MLRVVKVVAAVVVMVEGDVAGVVQVVGGGVDAISLDIDESIRRYRGGSLFDFF